MENLGFRTKSLGFDFGHWNKVLPASECQIRRPCELPIPNDPKKVLNFAIEVAVSDDEIDQTEWRIIEEFARYWSTDRNVLEKMKTQFGIQNQINCIAYLLPYKIYFSRMIHEYQRKHT